MPVLCIKLANNNSFFELTGEQTTVGRGNDNHLQLRDIKISRHHCLITKTADGYKIADLGSGNGTLVNNQKVKETLLNDNDLIKLGDAEITFSLKANGDIVIPDSSAAPSLPAQPPVEPAPLPSEMLLTEEAGAKTVALPKIEPLPDIAIFPMPPQLEVIEITDLAASAPPGPDDSLAKKSTVIAGKTGLPNSAEQRRNRLAQLTSRNKPTAIKKNGFKSR